MERIQVLPAETGWMVDASLLESALVFRSGAQAERAARRLAQACVQAGVSAEVVVHLRDGSLAGRLHYGPRR